MTHYTVTLIKDRSRSNNLAAIKAIDDQVGPGLAQSGVTVFGTFAPLFGLASNELYLVTAAEQPHNPGEALSGTGLDTLESIALVPTVRPVEHTPRNQPGIYVFRWFDVYNKDIDEIARLSNEAWTTFEGDFNTEVQGLFAEPDRSSERGRMLLITQYKDLAVWEASRQPSAEARENFIRRAQLTIEARPIATRLVTS